MTRRRLRKSSSTDSGEHKSLISDNKTKNPLPPPSRRLLKRQQSSFDSILYWWNDQNNRKFFKLFHQSEQSEESWFSLIWQISLIIVSLLLCCYTFFWFDHFHYHLTRFYAQHVDDHHAQHVLGHKLIRNRSHPEAFQWFRKSANNGHAHSAYNLAVGHLSGYRTDVKQGEVRQLLRYAAKNGVEEAKELLRGLCREKPKYCDL